MSFSHTANAIVQSLPDPVLILDQDGYVVCANEAAASILGCRMGELTRRRLADLLDESPEAVERKVQMWARSRQPSPGAFTLKDAGRPHRVACEAAAISVPDVESAGLVLVRCREHAESVQRFEALNHKIQELAREIRERQRTEEALRQSEERFRALFEHASDAILIANDEGAFIDANPAACALLGRTRAELLGLHVKDVAAPETRDLTERLWRDFLISDKASGSLTLATPSGEQREVEYSSSRNFVAGQHLSILRDATERRRQERELARQAEALAWSNAELEQFAYVASHDLQEPLRTISSFLQLIERRLKTVLDEETGEYMRLVRDAATRQRQVIIDLLELSRLGRSKRLNGRVDLQHTMDEILLALQSSIAEKGADVQVHPLPVVDGDYTQLYQLLLNIVHNAVKFCVERPRIEIRSERNGSHWIISVSDNGPGIDPEYFTSIFEPFRRLHGRDVPGSGIGLALCKRAAENHDGRIWVESVRGQGSTFHVALPAGEEAARQANATRD